MTATGTAARSASPSFALRGGRCDCCYLALSVIRLPFSSVHSPSSATSRPSITAAATVAEENL